MKRYWKVALLVFVLICCLAVFAGCDERKTGNRITGGKDIQTFTDCVVMLGDKVIVSGPITQWRDYVNGDEVQVLVNGKYYLTHYSNVVLIADPERGALNYSDPEWFTSGE